MGEYGCFDIIGPIMVGPSSSHTAGAVRLGRMAREIAGELPKEVKLMLYGSFAETYKGHGTDLALISGLLGFDTFDERIRSSFTLAKEQGLRFSFITGEKEERFHPNTVKFMITTHAGENLTVIGSSIGGGSVEITEINGHPLRIKGDFPTLITFHNDIPGVISKVSECLARYDINIAFMEVFRKEKRKTATMVVETDEYIPNEAMQEILKIEPISHVRFVQPV
ncbi:L-serine ammonia-lyase [Desulfonispora thiosulfatigenes DSM 11270]|uniref:L-serine deaminase n=1 Tax=Desulfonispora thiosulfatigenes DSM 11270 TaxID=656914 RepID=A0A1W1V957_DESTI|nr:L-serine ammonia-lyase, iron-sulfur-dependent subunit beta [Desulfonispora thiosulfatigenes]SMB89740.1 L-serine ammonia-lyase [Desulfonispora thiosulfatigenes DSM 11270]